MKHKIGYNPLGRTSSHRKALHRSMVTSLVLHERIRTTSAKAKAVRRTAEKMVTRAGVDSVHNRRIVGRDIKDKAALAKLFTDIGPRFKERPGGYTRILKIGQRTSDGAEMVILEFVAEELKKDPSASKKSKKKAAPKPEKAEITQKESPIVDEKSEESAEAVVPESDLSAEQPKTDDN
ncbi:MAG: 50S ribosomal protein L17 [Spirochaetota bacterium]